jgi:hypothetical protein
MSIAAQNGDASAFLDDNDPKDKIVLYALDEARIKLEQNGEFEPFTVVLHDDDLFVESHPGEDVSECFNSAKQTLAEMETLADAYVLAYDGYVQSDDGDLDALIVERGLKEADAAEAFALIYELDEQGDGSLTFEESIFSLGEAPSLFSSGDFDSEQLEELE